MSKNVVVEKKGEYVKGGKKRQEKFNQIRENLQKKKGEIHSKRTKKETWEKQMFKKEIKKGECPKKLDNTHKKREKKRQREWTNMEKHTNLRRCPTKS